MKNILLVIDIQNGFARYEQTEFLIKKIESLLKKNIFDTVVATRFINGKNSSFEKMFNWKNLETANEYTIPESIEKYVDFTIDKSIYNCVNNDFIQKIIQINDGEYPEKIFIVGADTDCCVLTIATALFECGIRPIVLTKYCDSNGGPVSHEAGITCLKRLIGKEQIIDKELFDVSDLETV